MDGTASPSKTLRFVLDANVLVSGLGWRGNEFRLWNSLRHSDHEIVSSRPILDEVGRTLIHKLRMPPTQALGHVARITQTMRIVVPLAVRIPSISPGDAAVVGTALAVEAHFVVTGDRALRHLRRWENTAMVRTLDALRILGESGRPPMHPR